MRARSLTATCFCALVVAATAAAAPWTASQTVNQGTIQTATLAAATANTPTLTPGGCVTNTNFQVTVSWTASTTPGVTGYQVYQATAAGGPWTLSSGSMLSPTSFNVTGLTNWSNSATPTTYFYVHTIRNNWTADSNQVSITGPKSANCK